MTIPEWRKAIETVLEKFRTHNCLTMAIYDGQHLVQMKWIFSIKTDGTYKARLVGRGDLIDGHDVCVRNFSSSVSMALRHSGIIMASSYDLGIRGSLIIMKQRRLMKSQCVFSKTRKLNSAWSICPRLILVLSFNARLHQY